MRKFIIAFLLVLAAACSGVTAHAAVGDFFHGEPGLSPESVMALAGPPLRGPAPVDYEYTQELGLDTYLAYNAQILDFEAYVLYYFNQEHGLQMATVSIPLTNIAPEVQQDILTQLRGLIEDRNDPFVDTDQSNEILADGYRHVYYVHWWLNAKYFITLHGNASFSENGSRQDQTNICNISLSFNALQNADAATLFAIERFKIELAADNQ